MSPYLSTITAFLSKSSLIWPACLNLKVQKSQRKKLLSSLLNKGKKIFFKNKNEPIISTNVPVQNVIFVTCKPALNNRIHPLVPQNRNNANK